MLTTLLWGLAFPGCDWLCGVAEGPQHCNSRFGAEGCWAAVPGPGEITGVAISGSNWFGTVELYLNTSFLGEFPANEYTTLSLPRFVPAGLTRLLARVKGMSTEVPVTVTLIESLD